MYCDTGNDGGFQDWGAITFAQRFGVSKEQVQKTIIEEYDKDEEEAEELIKMYWKG